MNDPWKLKVFVREDIASYGMTMDGVEYTAPVYYVVVQDEVGSRWAHERMFPGAKVVDTPHCERFHVDIADEAEKEAKRLRNRVQGSPNLIDWDRWSRIDPEYGSVAFMNTNAFGGDQYA